MKEQDFEQLLTKITMPWFYSKPVIFSIYCKHKIKPNPKCTMPFRSGKGFIEYNPQEIAKLEIPKSRKLLEMELYRLMLRHPYRRKPENCNDTLWYMASNMVIDPKYAVSQGFPYNQNIEFYYDELLKRKKKRKGKTVEIPPEESFEEDEKQDGEKDENNGSNEKQNDREQSGEQNNGVNGNFVNLDSKEENQSDEQYEEEDNGDATGLWGEDILENEKITKIIELHSDSNAWGLLPGNIVRETEKVRIHKVSDLQKKIQKFRESVSKSNRVLTRMRPNRRTGFDQMGSKYKPRPSKFLVGMDVSGSINDYYLSVFNTIALDICKKENAQMDILPFDADLQPLCKKVKTIPKYTGGGGTNYQPLINYVQKNASEYDGLIVFTDGHAPKPVIKTNLRIKILWVIMHKEGVQNWMNKRDFAAVIEENDNWRLNK